MMVWSIRTTVCVYTMYLSSKFDGLWVAWDLGYMEIQPCATTGIANAWHNLVNYAGLVPRCVCFCIL